MVFRGKKKKWYLDQGRGRGGEEGEENQTCQEGTDVQGGRGNLNMYIFIFIFN